MKWRTFSEQDERERAAKHAERIAKNEILATRQRLLSAQLEKAERENARFDRKPPAPIDCGAVSRRARVIGFILGAGLMGLLTVLAILGS
jgi:hypothetical protein